MDIICVRVNATHANVKQVLNVTPALAQFVGTVIKHIQCTNIAVTIVGPVHNLYERIVKLILVW